MYVIGHMVTNKGNFLVTQTIKISIGATKVPFICESNISQIKNMKGKQVDIWNYFCPQKRKAHFWHPEIKEMISVRSSLRVGQKD